MDKNYINKNYIDHYLQEEVIKRLASSKIPVRFTDLKEEGVDNSLFMYHVNKLIDRGLVEKTENGFTLTIKGVRWANFAGVYHSFNIITPRPLIQYVIRNKNNEILISSRRGQMKNKLNSYMFPGNIYQYGKNLEENSSDILGEIIRDNNARPKLLTVAEIIHNFEDGFTSHVISHIFEVELDGKEDINSYNELYNLEWMKVENIKQDNPLFTDSLFVPKFLSKIGNLSKHETFEIDQ